MKIPKQEYTAEFKELAVKRVKEGLTPGAIRTGLFGGLCIVRVFERGFCVRLKLRCIYSPPCYLNGGVELPESGLSREAEESQQRTFTLESSG